jgi:hypothetical protein
LVAGALGDKGCVVVWSGPEHDGDLRDAVEALLHQMVRHP